MRGVGLGWMDELGRWDVIWGWVATAGQNMALRVTTELESGKLGMCASIRDSQLRL